MAKLTTLSNIEQPKEVREQKAKVTKETKAQIVLDSKEWTLDTLREELDADGISASKRRAIARKYTKYRYDLASYFLDNLMDTIQPIEEDKPDFMFG